MLVWKYKILVYVRQFHFPLVCHPLPVEVTYSSVASSSVSGYGVMMTYHVPPVMI